MSATRDETVTVATVRRAHALKGELFVHLETDYPEEVFVEGRVLRVLGGGPLGGAGMLTVSGARPHGEGWILAFEEIADRTLAERYGGSHLSVMRDELVGLAEGEYFLHDLPGMTVTDQEGEPIGTVEDVVDTAASALLLVRHDGKESLVPFVREIVRDVDVEENVIRLRPPAGLLEV